MKHLVLFVSLLALAACESPDGAVTIANGTVSVELSADPPSLIIRDAGGRVLLQNANQLLFGVTHDNPEQSPKGLPGWDDYQAHEGPWTHVRFGRVVAVTATSASLELGGANGVQVTLDVHLDGDRVELLAHSLRDGDNKLELQLALPGDEHFFGLGERFASIDHRGLGLYAWAEEGGVGGGEDVPLASDNPSPNGPSMTYFPVPYHYSTSGYGMYVHTTRRTEMHMGDEADDRWRVVVNGAELPITLYVTPDPLVALDRYTEDSGRPLIPSAWVWGPWRRVDRETIVDGVPEYRLMRDRQIPVTTIEDAVHFLPHLSFIGIEPELRAWTAAVHDAGYKVLAYNNPYVSQTDPKAGPDYQYGASHGYFEKAPDGSPATTFFISGEPQMISAIDLTSPDAVLWFQSLLQRTLDFGYDGWMHDFGEYVARSSSFADGRNGEEVHNDFPKLSAKAAYDFWMARRPDDFIFHVRAGYAGSQSFAPVVWGGDAEADFDETQGLPSALRGGVNLGMSGVPYWGSDISGFKCLDDVPHDREVFYRWVEFGAVSPVMREENACSNPLKADVKKWNLWNDDDTQSLYRKMASLHTRLAPYFRALAVRAHETGTPIMIHPMLRFPRQTAAWATDDAYFLGDAIYAAPVVRRGVTERTVWLPPGRYLEWNEGTVATGPSIVQVPAPIDRLPMFLVEGQMIPMLDADVQTLAPTTDPSVVTESQRADVLDVVLLLGSGHSATFTLADGTTLTATRGEGGAVNTTTVTDPRLLSDCDACTLASTFGNADRVRATSSKAKSSELWAGDLHFVASGPIARRYRWDARLLP